MRGLLRHPLRVAGRFLWLAAEIAFGAAKYPFRERLHPAHTPLQTRALWLQSTCARVLRILNVSVRTEGVIPTRGFLSCNHISYLDILTLSSVSPAVFVSKREVKGWPVFGWFASMAGTLFIHRERRTDVSRVNDEMERTLANDVLLVLFPEGTSSDGETVLPFNSPLLEPAAKSSRPISVGFFHYTMPEGNVGQDVAYWGDMTFAPHLLNLLSLPSVSVTIRFAPVSAPARDRKELARQLHAHVKTLR